MDTIISCNRLTRFALFRFLLAAGTCSTCFHLHAQITISTSSTAALSFIKPSALPGPVRTYLGAFGNRIQLPGNELTVLVGTYTDASGSTQAQLSWQVPGSLRLDRASQPGKPLIYNSALAAIVGVALSTQDANTLESLLDDPSESFFYGFQSGTAHRLVGRRFRVDDGKTANYAGPWYDVYAAIGVSKAHPGQPNFIKNYYFDSVTRYLAKTRYLSSSTTVVTEFNNWVTVNGQSYPSQIVRTENGSIIFTLAFTGATIGPGISATLFSAP